MKRKLTLFLSAVMATSCLPMTAYAANFKDINELPWASVSINSAADRGLVSGYDENGARYYKPKNNVTYCEAMQMVYNSLQKTGTAAYMEATKTYSYMQTLTTIGVPRWAQIATAYGLENGLVDMQTVVANFVGGKQLATREDVARILGNAMAVRYDYEKVNSAAAEFKDYWRISDKAVSQVDLLKRLNIITGTNGNFLPKNNITRAEMAVMLNNTYDVLTEGVTTKGEITEITNNEGAFYYIEVKLPSGLKNGYYAKDDLTVYEGSTEKKIPVSRLSKGDQVELMMNGDTLLAIRQLTGVDAQAKYDVTGYWDSVKDGILEIENENTGDSDEYNVDNDTLYYLDGVKIKLKDLEEELKANYKKHAYVGVMTEVRRERNSDTKRYEDVTYAVEVHVTFTEEYTTSGEVKKLSSTNITVKPEGSSAEKDYILDASCKIYIGDEVVTVSKAKDLVESGTTYAKITVNQEGDVITLVLAEDTFENSPAKADATTYKVVSFSDKKMVLKSNAKETTYTFGSTNPVNNIAFYAWKGSGSDAEWDDVDVDDAEKYVDNLDVLEKSVYCRIETNKGGKLTEVYLSDTRSAWTLDETQTERKGTVASVKDGVLKFKTSTVEYELLSQYNRDVDSGNDDLITGVVGDMGEVAYPLNNTSAATSSLKVFERMANDSSIELYAEILADSDNKVLKIDARAKSAEGTLVKYDDDDNIIEIKTKDGNTFRLNVTNSPDTADEDEYTAEDLATTGYVGSYLELEFNSEGLVDEITVTDSTYGTNIKRAKGIVASVTDKTLKLEGNSETFTWLPESKTNYDNFSMESTSWYRLKNELLADDALEVYVELQLSDEDKIESIDLYVRSAEGELENYDESDDTVRIKTASGNRFTFDCKGTLTVDLSNLTQEDLDDGDGNGKDVKLTFTNEGLVSKIAKG